MIAIKDMTNEQLENKYRNYMIMYNHCVKGSIYSKIHTLKALHKEIKSRIIKER